MDFTLHYIGHNVIENAPFEINRPEGSYRYIFFHFISSVSLETPGGIIEASPGSCILYEPGAKQRFFVKKHRLNHDYIDFVVNDEDFFESIRFPMNAIFNPRMSKEISEMIKRIHEEGNSNRVGGEYVISSILINLFVSISRKIHHSAGYDKAYAEKVQKNFERLRLNVYHDPGNFSVKNMAEMTNYSLPYFNKLYRKFFGISPIEDLTKAKISYVKTLLENGEPTSVILSKLGYTSPEYFYRWFKKHFNMTPNQYKEILKEKKDETY